MTFNTREVAPSEMIAKRIGVDPSIFSRGQNYTPINGSNVINNNITMNGYSAQSGGELIGAMTSRQMQTSDLNMTSSQMTTIGSI